MIGKIRLAGNIDDERVHSSTAYGQPPGPETEKTTGIEKIFLKIGQNFKEGQTLEGRRRAIDFGVCVLLIVFTL